MSDAKPGTEARRDVAPRASSAADVVVYELRPLLMMEVLSQLDGHDEHDADEIVERVLEAVVEGRIWVKRQPGETLSTVLRLAGLYARRHLREEHDELS